MGEVNQEEGSNSAMNLDTHLRLLTTKYGNRQPMIPGLAERYCLTNWFGMKGVGDLLSLARRTQETKLVGSKDITKSINQAVSLLISCFNRAARFETKEVLVLRVGIW
jgi:hypothetical protein